MAAQRQTTELFSTSLARSPAPELVDEDSGRRELMAEAARLYYQDNCTQSAIGQQLHLSRSTVSRLLAEAKRTNLVEVVIHYPWLRAPELEAALIERFHLKDARVLIAKGRPYAEVLRGLGVMAAQWLEHRLTEGMTLGVSWGTGVYATVEALRPGQRIHVKVVQFQGAMGDRLIDGREVAHYLASLYGGEFHFVHAPLIVESPLVGEALLQEPSIREALGLATQADLALVGIGSVVPEVSSLLRSGAVTEAELCELSREGLVGDVCGRQFDAQGAVPDNSFNRRVISVSAEGLRKIPVVIGVAGGLLKVPAILGALRGRLVNVLVTDSDVARRLLTLQPAGLAT